MTKLLIYLFPFLMDIIIGAVLFICPTLLAQDKQEAIVITGVASVWALAYMVASHFIGKRLTQKNATPMLIGSCVSITLLCGSFVIFPGLVMMFILMALLGTATAFFFSPFQVFMKAVGGDHDGGVVKSTALYTFSWSAGMAAGPFISAYLWSATSWQACFGVMGACSIITGFGIYMLKHHAETHEPGKNGEAEPQQDSIPAIANRYEKMPDLAYMGWIVSGLGILVNLMMRALLPDTGETLGLAKTQTGNILFLLSGVQATVGLLMIKSRFWMFRKLPTLLFNLCGIASLAMFALCNRVELLYLAAILGGIYTGSMYFSLVFHSLIHPKKSWQICVCK